MAQITELQETQTLSYNDQTLLRQGAIDKRISLILANILSWAARNNFTFIGNHSTGIQFTSERQFTVYNGRAYFTKSTTPLPYTSNFANPVTDNSLRVYEEANSGELLELIQSNSTSLTNHKNDRSNPHGVTKSQVGLGNVNNWTASSSTTLDSSTTYATSRAVKLLKDALDSASNSSTSHANNRSNPHGVTKSQVGLGSVNNWSASSSVSSSSTTTYATSKAAKDAYDRGSSAISSLSSHQSASNPHNITKSTVGLSNVQNYGISDSTSSSSSSSYASSKAVKIAYDLANGKLSQSTADGRYLGKTAKAADSNLLDGLDSSAFTRANADDTISGVHTHSNSVVLQNSKLLRLGTSHQGDLWSDGSNTMLRMNNNAEFRVAGSNSVSKFTFNTTTSVFTSAGDIVGFSDNRIKKNKEMIKDALSKVLTLNGMTYDRTDLEGRHVGLIAQEVREVLPEAVKIFDNKDLGIKDFHALSYEKVVPLLVEAIKELAEKVESKG